ncbi:unnamed protein product, partial [Porites lobata]
MAGTEYFGATAQPRDHIPEVNTIGKELTANETISWKKTFALLSCYLWCHVTLSSKYGEAVVECPVLELSFVHLCVLR